MKKMIISKHGMVHAEGSTQEILADLSCVIRAITENGLSGIGTKEKLKEEVQKAVDMGFEGAESDGEDEMGSDLEDALASLFRSMAESLEKGKGEK